MRWIQIEAGWTQIKSKLAFWPFRMSDDDSERAVPTGVETSRVSQGEDPRPEVYRPDDLGPRSDFSLHIGC